MSLPKKKKLTKGFYASHVADYWPCVGGIWDVGIPGFLEAAFMLLIKIGATYFIIFLVNLNSPLSLELLPFTKIQHSYLEENIPQFCTTLCH
jgi:hypothetical protein